MARVRSTLVAATLGAGLLLAPLPAFAAAPPTPVSALSAAPADRQVTLTWTNPADPDFAGVVVVRKDGATPPAALADGTEVYRGTAQTKTVTGLTNGATYSFAVFTTNTSDDVSDPAVVTTSPVPATVTTVSLTVAPTTITYGTTTLLTAVVRRTDTGEALAGAVVELWRKPYGASTYSLAYRVTTNSSGVATHTAQPGQNTRWYAVHGATPYFAASHSSVVVSYVRPTLKLTRAPLVVEQNAPSTVTASVWPSHTGQKVLLQRYYDGQWHGSAEAYLTSSNVATFAVRTFDISTRTYRVVKPADADHAQAVSGSFGITTIRRTLASGMSGSDVTAVQQRLAALHYDPGTVNGFFGYDTLHATAAFQKTNGLPVTGTVDPTTYAKLWKPRTPTLLHPQSGSWIEIDLTRQTLVYGRDGKVLRILDVSSGSGKYFTVDGQTQQAITPTGSFRIFHKIDGMRVSRLGELWRPAYFASGGYAIHGNSSVPFYPASHGCVRITNSAMNRLFNMLYIGMHVYVYRS